MARGKPDFAHLPVTIRRWKGFKRQRIEIHRDLVTVTERAVFGEKKWAEPVSAYKGVLLRTSIGPGGYYEGIPIFSNVRYYRLELAHLEHEKTLLLYETNDLTPLSARVFEMWEPAARTLNLPALKQTPDDG